MISEEIIEAYIRCLILYKILLGLFRPVGLISNRTNHVIMIHQDMYGVLMLCSI